MTCELPHRLITSMCHDHIVAAAQMLRLTDYTMARYELTSALETLAQLQAISHANPKPKTVSIVSPTLEV